jgi:hypothetical protein
VVLSLGRQYEGSRVIRTVRSILPALLTFLAASTVWARDPSPERVIPLQPYLRAQASVRATVGGVTGTFMFDTGEGLSTISPAFAARIGCRPWGRVSGFRMSGERLNNPHCDNVDFDLAGERLTAPAVTTVDVMAFIGQGVPSVDGSLGLDLFAGKAITIVPRREIIIESPASLAARIRNAREIPIRLVRDVEGLALSVDTAVRTSQGLAWMEMDTGNGGSMVIADHIAPLLGMAPDTSTPTPARFQLANGIVVEGNARTRDLIMDGNIGAQFLNRWNITLDLRAGRAWLSPADPS